MTTTKERQNQRRIDSGDTRPFTVVRLKTNGISIHEVYVDTKQQALELVWPDDSKQVGRFVTGKKVSYPERFS